MQRLYSRATITVMRITSDTLKFGIVEKTQGYSLEFERFPEISASGYFNKGISVRSFLNYTRIF